MKRSTKRLQVALPLEALGEALPATSPDALRPISRENVYHKSYALQQLVLSAYRGELIPHDTDPAWYSLSREYLAAEVFHCNKGKVAALMAVAFERNEGLVQRPYKGELGDSSGTPAGYRLRPDVLAALDRLQGPFPVVDPAPLKAGAPEGKQVKPEDLLATQWAGITIPAVFPLDPEVQQCPHLRRWATSWGGIPNLYRPSITGRLAIASPTAAEVGHIQQMSAAKRAAALRGSGLVDYDLRSSYQLVYLALCSEAGLDSPAVEGYVQHKAETLAFVASATGASVSDVKDAALAVLNGGSLWGSPPNLREYPLLVNMREEVQRNLRVLTEMFRSPLEARDTGMGFLPTTQGGEELARKATALFQGYEQVLVQALAREIDAHGGTVYAWLGDGLIVREGREHTAEEMELHLQRVAREVLGLKECLPQLSRKKM